ncbi:hypothetical protein P3T76_012577 [Phytophthora citrophthora]|uniref:EF-hand domain-containing protein n=1 Tax=Phytophthora citrophthora TaxID=4793 RepID=A0AAD9LDU7_9STRA|nr:hypothetical protein P3T76_012577 [Phytophthora citrophthora]
MAGVSLFRVGEDVEFWRVLAHLSILAAFLLLFEFFLHYAERHLSRYDKYYQMLQKVYRELMILGLLSLVVKILKEVAPIDANGKVVVAFEVADLIIFGFAISLVLQALCIFLLVGRYSKYANRAELMTTRDLLVDLQKQQTNFIGNWSPTKTFLSVGDKPVSKTVTNKEIVRYRTLRHFFLRRFGLPQLFPFSRYIRRTQAQQLSHMIHVEPMMWLLVLTVAWAICGLLSVLEGVKLVKLLTISSWILVLLHCLVLVYLRWCVHQILATAGYSTDNHILCANLAAVADEEISAWESESAENALDMMHRVHELQEEMEHERNDKGFTNWCKCFTSSKADKILKSPRHENPGSNDMKIRFFSSGFWHVVVKLLLALNGFFVALFVQCALYNLDEISQELGMIIAISVPFPMLVNTLVLQQFIFRDFTLLCTVLHLNANALGDVTSHFVETVELQSQFAASVLQCLKDGGLTIGYLETVVRSHDLNSSGLIDIDSLRAIMASVGFSLTQFRFQSVIKLLFDLKRAKVSYIQLFHLLFLVQQDGDSERRSGFPEFQQRPASFDDKRISNSISVNDLSSIQQFALLAQSSVASDLASSDFSFLRTVSPTLRRVSMSGQSRQQPPSKVEDQMRRSLMQRSYTNQVTGSTSRVLHYMYNLRQLARFQEELALRDSAVV